MIQHFHHNQAKLGSAFSLVISALGLTIVFAQQAKGLLIAELGIPPAVAFAIVTLIGTGGIDIAIAVYPIIAPAIFMMW